MANAILSGAKKCPRCNSVKDANHFYKNSRHGLSPYCKPCSAAYKRKGALSRGEITASVYPASEIKVCSKCRESKPFDSFNKRLRNGKEYLRSQCKSCQAAHFKSWALATGRQEFESRDALREAVRSVRYPEPSKKLCSGCGEVKLSEEFGSRIQGGICKSCRSAQEAHLYARNKDSRKEYVQRYKQENLEKVRRWAVEGQRRRAWRLKSAQEAAMATDEERAGLINRYGLRCMRCGTDEKVTFDHIVPLVMGGDDGIGNLQLLCGPCNSSKATKTTDYRPRA